MELIQANNVNLMNQQQPLQMTPFVVGNLEKRQRVAPLRSMPYQKILFTNRLRYSSGVTTPLSKSRRGTLFAAKKKRSKPDPDGELLDLDLDDGNGVCGSVIGATTSACCNKHFYMTNNPTKKCAILNCNLRTVSAPVRSRNSDLFLYFQGFATPEMLQGCSRSLMKRQISHDDHEIHDEEEHADAVEEGDFECIFECSQDNEVHIIELDDPVADAVELDDEDSLAVDNYFSEPAEASPSSSPIGSSPSSPIGSPPSSSISSTSITPSSSTSSSSTPSTYSPPRKSLSKKSISMSKAVLALIFINSFLNLMSQY